MILFRLVLENFHDFFDDCVWVKVDYSVNKFILSYLAYIKEILNKVHQKVGLILDLLVVFTHSLSVHWNLAHTE